MKNCSKCKFVLSEEEFTKDKKQRSGLSCWCKNCVRKNNIKNIKWRKEYNKVNSDKRKDYMRKYRLDNIEKFKKLTKQYVSLNRDKTIAYQKEYRNKNREKLLAGQREYSQKNKTILREKANERRRKRMKSDVCFKLLHNLRRRLGLIIEGKRKADTTKKLIGCDLEFLKEYLQQMFDENMNWINYGSYWEIDHISPCKSFNLLDGEEQRKCFHYTNLQPLPSEDNRAKGAKIIIYAT